MLKEIFGSEAAGRVLKEVWSKGSTNAYSAAKEQKIGITSAREQLNKFHEAGLLVCKEQGKAWEYSFNDKNRIVKYIKLILKELD